MNHAALQADIERLTSTDAPDRAEARAAVAHLLDALSAGDVRAAEQGDDGWHAIPWVKKGILLAFRTGQNAAFTPHPADATSSFGGSTFRFFDRDTLPLRPTEGVAENVRIVPGGTSVKLSGNRRTGGTCFGDSGGPLLLNDTNIVVAVTSFGINGNCAGVGGGYRVDMPDDLDWVLGFLD